MIVDIDLGSRLQCRVYSNKHDSRKLSVIISVCNQIIMLFKPRAFPEGLNHFFIYKKCNIAGLNVGFVVISVYKDKQHYSYCSY